MEWIILMLVGFAIVFFLIVSQEKMKEKEKQKLKARIDGGDLDAHIELGFFLIDKERKISEALQEFEKAYNKGINKPQSYFDFGVLLMNNADFAQAKNWLEIADKQGHKDAKSKLKDCQIKLAPKRTTADEPLEQTLGWIFTLLGGGGLIGTLVARDSAKYQLDGLAGYLGVSQGYKTTIDILFYVSIGVLLIGVVLLIIDYAKAKNTV